MLHREICLTAEECGLFRVPLPDEALDVVMQEELERGYEFQVARRTMKRSDDGSYRLTFKGVLLLLPRSWATWIRGLLCGSPRRRDRQQLERVEREVRGCLALPTTVRTAWPDRHWMQDQVG